MPEEEKSMNQKNPAKKKVNHYMIVSPDLLKKLDLSIFVGGQESEVKNPTLELCTTTLVSVCRVGHSLIEAA